MPCVCMREVGGEGDDVMMREGYIQRVDSWQTVDLPQTSSVSCGVSCVSCCVCACDGASLLSCAPCCLLVAVVMGKPLLFAQEKGKGRSDVASCAVSVRVIQCQ